MFAKQAPAALGMHHVTKFSVPTVCVRRIVLGHQMRTRVSVCSTAGAQPEVKISIEGMMCDGCSSRIENVLKGTEAVKTVSVSLEGKVAVVQLAKGSANLAEAQAAAAALVDTIKGLGFEAQIQN